MVLIAVTCPYCQSDHITKRGKTDTDKQRKVFQSCGSAILYGCLSGTEPPM